MIIKFIFSKSIRAKQTKRVFVKAALFYKQFVKKPGIGQDVIDALEKAYNAASGPIKEDIKYMYDCVYGAMSAYKTF